METSEAVVIGGEDYKVVDECLEEEDSLNIHNHLNQMENLEINNTQNSIGTEISNYDISKETQIDIKEDIKIVCDIASNIKEKDKKTCIPNTKTMEVKSEVMLEVIPEVKLEENKNSINLIADITSNQLNEQKNLTDEEVMHHLDEIESIVLNSKCFMDSNENKLSETESLSENIVGSIDSNEKRQSETENIVGFIDSNENKQSEAENLSKNIVNEDQEVITKPSIVLIDILSPNIKTELPIKTELSVKTETHWYEKKLTEKLDTIKERMSKLARVLENSYPIYKTWLEYTEKVYGSPICKLEPPRRWPLDKHHTNRWKFNCSRMSVEVSKKGDASLHSKEKVWRVEPAGAWGVSKHTIPEIPPFVLRAVKIFEDFLQSVQQADEALLSEQFSSDTCIEIDQKNETKPRWLWLIVRCNSIDEIMLFVTGKNISRSTMDHLKQVYESGPGKDCNVKSIYCESIYNKSNDTVASNTTFLVGSEVLDEVVGGIKVQLAPKTSFWSNPVGAENVAKTVIELLAPSSRTTVLEVGCGFGLIGLMVASKCRKIIGVDSKSEIEEAEMTCELNNINNASFIVGSSSEITSVIANILRNCKASAIINTSTNVGRAIDLMICLRKIISLKRLVMITTLTKQSVRAIIELVRPGNRNMGNPFIPVKAYLVDTLPIGPYFEIVILMERHLMFNQPWFFGALQETNSSSNADSSKKQPIKPAAFTSNKKMNQKTIIDKKTGFTRSKGKSKGKRAHSPDRNEGPAKKFARKFDKIVFKPRRGDLSRRKDKVEEGSELCINPMYEKKMRENNDRIDLREKLSNNRIDPDILNKVKEQQAILDIAKEKLSGSSATVDVTTAKELQDMLNMVLEQTNKLQNQLPRSVWDRIAPPEITGHSIDKKDNQSDPLLKGRYIQEIGAKDILITKENKQFLENDEKKLINPIYKKYGNIVPMEPNLLMPTPNDTPILNRSLQKSSPERYYGSDFRKYHSGEISWNKNKSFDKTCWSESSSTRKQTPSPVRKHISPIRHRLSPSRRFSPKRPLLSPSRKHMSPLRRPMSPFRSRNTLIDRPFSPPNRSISGSRRPLSPPRRAFSPLMHQISPRRHMSPPKQHASSMRTSVTSPRRKMSPIRHQISKRHHLSSSGRMITSSRREMQRMMLISQERQHQAPMRVESSFRVISNRPMSPLNRQITPPERYADDWDIPSRGAIEQSTWHPSSRIPNKSWRDERQSSNSNWDQQTSNINRYRNSTQIVNQDKWDIKNSSQDNMRISNGGDIWNTKLSSMMQGSKDIWTTNFDNRWSGSSNLPLNNDNWNIRGKESFSSRDESWMDKNKSRWTDPQMIKDIWNQKRDKDDWNDLPEDAIDPWSDDNSVGLKERWYKFDPPSTSSWGREHEMMDSWSNQKDNWQNKGQSAGASKSLWESNNNQNIRDVRWIDISKKLQPSACQSGNTLGTSWQQQPVLNLQSQRSFTMNHFKDL